MKTLVCAAAALIVVSLLQSASASRIDFQASVSNIYPVVTKHLTLRCAVKQDTHTDDANRTSINQPEVQSTISASTREIPALQRRAIRTQQAPGEFVLSSGFSTYPSTGYTTHLSTGSTTHLSTGYTTHLSTGYTTHPSTGSTTHPSTGSTTHPSTGSTTPSTGSTTPSTGFSRSTVTSHPQTTVGHQDTTHGNVSYIESIIISKLDTTTGQLQSIAWLSPYDPPATSIDPDNINVNGTIESQDEPQEGYLEISWEYPTEAQSGVYVCDIYGLDSTLRAVALKSSVHVGASETTVSQLAGLVAQLQKQVVYQQQSLTDTRNQISNLKQENQRQFEALNNTTDTLFNKTNDIKSQNIQMGNVGCSNTFVTFPNPYSEDPKVFVSIYDLSGTFSSFAYSVTVQDLNSTGFIPYCAISAQISTLNVTWIAVDN